jgi:hypothetical protein
MTPGELAAVRWRLEELAAEMFAPLVQFVSSPTWAVQPVREHVLAAGRAAGPQVPWRNGSRGPLTSFFVVLRVRPAGRQQGWPSSLPEDTDLAELVRLATICWRIEHDYWECKTAVAVGQRRARRPRVVEEPGPDLTLVRALTTVSSVHPYKPGSWGPAEADALAGPDGWLLGP